MNQSTELQIEECESRLKQAMLQSDISVLDELLAADLVFTNHLGQRMTKQDDIAAHKSGMLKIDEVTLSQPEVKIYADVAIVSVQTHISGSFAEKKSENDFRFTRVWHRTADKNWQVVVGHSSIIV